MKYDQGIAVLETALMSMLLAGLLFSAVATTDYLDQVRTIHQTAELYLGDSGLRPFSLNANPDAPAPGLTLNRAELEHYLASVVRGAASSIAATSFSLEAKYVVADIDPASGAFEGFDPAAVASSSGGSMTLSREIASFIDLDRRFDAMASAIKPDTEVTSLIAVPIAVQGMEGTANHYLNRSLLVGLRLAVSLEGTLTGNALTLIGQEPVVYGYKVVQLRGVVQ